jgi:hypothetical protein
VKIVQQGRNYPYLNFHRSAVILYGTVSVNCNSTNFLIFELFYTRSTTSERNFGTLSKVNRLCVLSENCSGESKLLVSQFS